MWKLALIQYIDLLCVCECACLRKCMPVYGPACICGCVCKRESYSVCVCVRKEDESTPKPTMCVGRAGVYKQNI